MKWQPIMYGVVTLMGAALVFLNVWLVLLEPNSRSFMWIGLGLLFMVGGVLNIRRFRRENPS